MIERVRAAVHTVVALASLFALAGSAIAQSQGDASTALDTQDDPAGVLPGGVVWFEIHSVTIADKDKYGFEWDNDGSAPDVKIYITAGGRTIETPAVESYTPAHKIDPIIAVRGTRFEITIVDVDDSTEQAIGTIAVEPTQAGFGVLSGGQVMQFVTAVSLRDAWELPELRVLADFALNDDATTLLRIALGELNRSLVDITDGQISIAKVAVYQSPWPTGVTRAPGTVVLTRSTHDERARQGTGSPTKPVEIVTELAEDDTAESLATKLLDGFGRAYLGLDGTDDANVPWLSGRLSQCRAAPDDAGGDDEHDGLHIEDQDEPAAPTPTCWDRMTSAVKSDLSLTLRPGRQVSGPLPDGLDIEFPSPDFDLDGAGGSERLASATIDAVVKEHAAYFGKCLLESDKSSARINFAIRGNDGRVTSVKVNGNSDGALHKCVHAVMREMKFPTVDGPRTLAEFDLSR